MHERPEVGGKLTLLRRHGHTPVRRPQRFYHPDAPSGNDHRPTGPRFVPLDASSPAGGNFHPLILTKQAERQQTNESFSPFPADSVAHVQVESTGKEVAKAGGRWRLRRRQFERRKDQPTQREEPELAAGGPPTRPPERRGGTGTPEEPERGETIAQRHPDWNIQIRLVVGAAGTAQELTEGLREHSAGGAVILYEDPHADADTGRILQEAASAPPDSSVGTYLDTLDAVRGDGTSTAQTPLGARIRSVYGTGAIVRRLDIGSLDPLTAETLASADRLDNIDTEAPISVTLGHLAADRSYYASLQRERQELTVHRHLESVLEEVFEDNSALQDAMRDGPLTVVIQRDSRHQDLLEQGLRQEGFAPIVVQRQENLVTTYMDRLEGIFQREEVPNYEDLARAHMEHIIRSVITEGSDAPEWMDSQKFARYVVHVAATTSMQDIAAIHALMATGQMDFSRMNELITENGLPALPRTEAELDTSLTALPENAGQQRTEEARVGRTIAKRHPDWNLHVKLVVGSHRTGEEELAGTREHTEGADIVLYEDAGRNYFVYLFTQEAAYMSSDIPVEQYLERLAPFIEANDRTDMMALEPIIRATYGTGAVVRPLDVTSNDAVTGQDIENYLNSFYSYIVKNGRYDRTLQRLLDRQVGYAALQKQRDVITIHQHLETDLAYIFAANPELQATMRDRPLEVVITRGTHHKDFLDQALRQEGIIPVVFVRQDLEVDLYNDIVRDKVLAGVTPTKEELERAHLENMISALLFLETEDSEWLYTNSSKLAQYQLYVSSNMPLPEIPKIHRKLVKNRLTLDELDGFLQKNGLRPLPRTEEELEQVVTALEREGLPGNAST